MSAAEHPVPGADGGDPLHPAGPGLRSPRALIRIPAGSTVAAAVRAAPGDRRVALVASGSFSLEVGGPHLDQGRIFGVPDPGWATRVLGYLARGDLDGLIAAATPSQLAAAGNVGGELLNWIAVAAAAGSRPGMLEAQEQFGHAYAWWNLADGSDRHGER